MWGILWYIHRQPSVTRIPCHSLLPLWAHQPSWYLPWIIHELPVLFCEKSPCWLRKSHGNPRKRNMCVWKLVIYGYTVIPQFMAMFGRENMEKWGLTWINPWFFRATMVLHRSGLWHPKKKTPDLWHLLKGLTHRPVAPPVVKPLGKLERIR